VIDDQDAILQDFRALLLPAGATAVADELDALEAALGGVPSASAGATLPAFEVSCARQGLDGIELVRSSPEPYAVAFIDIHMPPGIDGIETARRLWEIQPSLEIVLCTAHSTYSWNDILARLPYRGQFVILRKPFDPIEVRQLATCLSEKWQRGQEVAANVAQLELRVQNEVARRIANELGTAQRFEALGRLAAGIAHEINTPSQYVLSSLEFLHDAMEELAPDLPGSALIPEMTAAIDDALVGIERLSAIVRSVREHSHSSRIESGDVDLNRQIRIAVELARTEYKHVADLVLDLHDDLPVVRGYADELGRAVMNLLVNAAHAIAATRTRGRITIATRTHPGRVVMSVSDTGIGIPAEHRDRVFDPFFTTKNVGEGTGQGLAFVRSAVERHRGHIALESCEGRGTTFHITVPVLEAV
jgi:signal transduction histidine kinase